MCCSLGSWQRSHATRVGTAAFHCDRRWRVLLRDIFRFGTATATSPASRRRPLRRRSSRPSRHLQANRRAAVPPNGCRRRRGGGPGRPRAGLRTEAQAGAVVLAHRLHRQCEHHRITQYGFEVEQAVLDEEPVLVFLGVVGRLRFHGPGRRRQGTSNISWNSASSCCSSGSRHLTHSPLTRARAVPVTSTPSMTDSRRSSSSTGAPSGTPMTRIPRYPWASIVRVKRCSAPGRRPSSVRFVEHKRVAVVEVGVQSHSCFRSSKLKGMPPLEFRGSVDRGRTRDRRARILDLSLSAQSGAQPMPGPCPSWRRTGSAALFVRPQLLGADHGGVEEAGLVQGVRHRVQGPRLLLRIVLLPALLYAVCWS